MFYYFYKLSLSIVQLRLSTSNKVYDDDDGYALSLCGMAQAEHAYQQRVNFDNPDAIMLQ